MDALILLGGLIASCLILFSYRVGYKTGLESPSLKARIQHAIMLRALKKISAWEYNEYCPYANEVEDLKEVANHALERLVRKDV